MSRRFTYTTNLEFSSGDECGPDHDVTVSFACTGGAPETPPSYASGGSPAEDAEIDFLRLEKVDGKPRPWGMYGGNIPNEDDAFAEMVEMMLDTPAHREAMLIEAAEQMASDAADAAEYRYESARDDRAAGWD